METEKEKTNKKLTRSTKDSMIAGVCGGMGDYFNHDSTTVRIIWTLIVLFTGIFPGVIVYLALIFIVPKA